MIVLATACASTVDGSRGAGLDASAPRDVPPGRNADGFDPFRPADVALPTDAAGDANPWDLRDAAVFDQRLGNFTVGLFANEASATSFFSAQFRLFPRPDDPRCMQTAAGVWSIQRCRQDQAAVRDPHPTPFPHGGELRVTGGSRDVVVRPNTTGAYPSQSSSDPIFRDGATLSLRASGSATVPPFSLPLTLPPALRVTSPRAGETPTVSREEDFVVTWEPIEARLVSVTLQFSLRGPPTTSVRIDVQAPGDVGRAVIPARVLRQVELGTDSVMASLTVQPSNLVLGRIGPWPLQVTVIGRGANFSARLP